MNYIIVLYPLSFKLPLCWLHSLTPVTSLSIPVIFQTASLLAALTHPGHIVSYAPGDSLPCRRDAS
ncbi:hypothetical protein CKY12_10370 [Photorhabdus sp. S12-55]|nr:hypothetical protein PluDJC_06400 [Photorhabdus laumondii subsp. laumondii]RAW69677.1 hypothetical protein CKY15_13495 [Photorhabdus sp. S7-51]RAW71841.1 hypothetical protein CKY14_11325 [Photorhabdus sp. S14-60]RAW78354.1 hypothetical protein CKY06_08505 [Photorhabdus sp. S15-56]RAW85237.1 hypothetical protein CKY12_10370 [Photorhabdus sp. S12-55]RAW85331.1 hypothetical protein CKY09_10635 [Photorhabdus sp. S5P8-50]